MLEILIKQIKKFLIDLKPLDIASIFVAFPLPHVIALGKAIGAVLKPADDKMGPLVDEACGIAEARAASKESSHGRARVQTGHAL